MRHVSPEPPCPCSPLAQILARPFSRRIASACSSAWTRCAPGAARDHRVASQARALRRARPVAAARARRAADRPRLDLPRTQPPAGLNMHDDDGKKAVLGGGAIVGIGVVAGKRCIVSASDSALKEWHGRPDGVSRSAARAADRAGEQAALRLPFVESGGANLMYQAEIFIEGGRSFANQARMSAAGIPQIAVARLVDRRRRVPARAVGLRGPDGSAAARKHLPRRPAARQGRDRRGRDRRGRTRRRRDPRRGHGPRRIPVRERRARDRAGPRAGWTLRGTLRSPASSAAAPTLLFDEQDLLGIVPADDREPYDVREVIARLVDGSDFLEVQAALRGETVCGHARVEASLVGILGNNGPIQPTGSTKAAQFIQLCDQSGTPLVFRRTPPATWSARGRSAAARSSTAAR